ncbi:hypothetical protein SAMN04515674_11161 [Pseudarcicella hirudinis]|uniref:Uncharacterized protein n=2 Tax=Pseudarcicella hirudinis TaxID=1079859 RepID=A0A1I5W9H6_9BACT|nr:hypothetical protein SAMN04515674_11161 [Pseudarcicella hirudinis]
MALIGLVLLNSCSKSDSPAVEPEVSISGKWSITGLGTITDLKTYDATLEEIAAVSNNKDILKLKDVYSYEFKTDGTYVAGTDSGTWILAADKKQVTLTSKVNVDSNKKPAVLIFQVFDLAKNSVKLGFKKFSKNASGNFDTTSLEDFAYFSVGIMGMAGKGGTQADLDKVKTLQGTLNLKR